MTDTNFIQLLNDAIEKTDHVLSLLGEGVESGDWSKVIMAYSILTGEPVDEITPSQQLPKRTPVFPRESDANLVHLSQKKDFNFSTSRKTRGKVRSGEVNLFELTPDIDLEAKKQNGYEAIKDKPVGFKRQTRPAYKPVSARCTSCGANEETNRILANAKYLCTKCQSRTRNNNG